MTAGLTLNFLGTLEVIRDGQVVPLPPSKKTRALLAYLAMNPQPVRREQLCELLWEIPDDPRGSLRWSLSKLRCVVDDADHARVIADRLNVGFNPAGADIDVVALHAFATQGLEHASVEALERCVARCRGNFLEGLELPNSYDFHTWCIAERELAVRSYTSVLRALVERLRDEPQRALPHARKLVAIASYDEAAHATLLRILASLRHTEEAKHQYQVAKRLLQEVGVVPSPVLHEAWRGLSGTSVQRETSIAVEQPPPSSLQSATPVNTLIGRDAELRRLTRVLADVTQQGRAAFMLIRGDPGIGKSRLLEAAAGVAGAADACILEAAAFESEALRPFGLWIDALSGPAASHAPSIFGGADHDNRERLISALSQMIAQESANRPVVLLFDDMQWCDESSATALHYIARMNRQRPVLGLLAAREDELRDNAAVQQALRGLLRDGMLEELKLTPLTETCARELIQMRAPHADSEALSKACGGNPLLAVELARSAGGEGGSSLDDLIRERMRRCDDIGVEVLRWAAVLSPRIDLSALLRVTGLSSNDIGVALESAERHAILRSSERGIRFSHDLVTRAVYADISPARRRVMHHRVAELLEQDTAIDLGHATDLARHALQSGDFALAARATVSAGRLCLRFFANDDALALARTGLQLAAQLRDATRVRVTIDLREIMLAAAPVRDWEAAASEYVALAEQAIDHGALSHARVGYYMASYVRWAHGHWSAAREGTLQAERVTRGASDEEHIVGMAETARCLAMLERDLPQADAMSMEARALAQRCRMQHRAIPAAIGILRYHENKLHEAEELFEEARTLCKSAGDRVFEYQALEYLVMIEIERGRYAAALERCSALKDIGDKLREGSEAPFARAVEGLCLYATRNDTAQLETALVELRCADAKHRLAYTLTRAALLDVERGRPQDALARAREALGYAELLDRRSEILLAHVALARAHRAAGEEPDYEQHVAAINNFAHAPVARWAQNVARSMLG